MSFRFGFRGRRQSTAWPLDARLLTVHSAAQCMFTMRTDSVVFATSVSVLLAQLFQANCQTSLPNSLTLETEVEQRSQVPSSDFIYPFTQVDQSSTGGDLRGLFINNNPALATLPNGGVGQNLVTLQACAINQPHVHPRGTEISHVTQGTLLFGFLEENASADKKIGGRFINGNVTKGQTIIVPQGLVHFAQNLGCDTAQFIATFPSSDPGTSTIFNNVFGKLPVSAIRATTGLDDTTVEALQAVIARQVNPSVDPVCLQRCNMPPVSAPQVAANYTQAPGVLDGYRRL